MRRIGQAALNAHFYNYKANARKRGIVWGLDPEAFHAVVSLPCAYCGADPIPNNNHNMYKDSFLLNGIDRIDSARGYVVDNCAPCCKVCNRMKGTMSADDFRAHAKKITDF
jgi:hypothetical protein